MYIAIPNFTSHHKFWFIIRKCIFQGVLPSILALVTFYDFVANTDNTKPSSHTYFYTSMIIFAYTNIKIFLELIFDTCSETVIFKKELKLNIGSLHLDSTDLTIKDKTIIIIKRIYKLRYCTSSIFNRVDNVCWALGIDSPILIPHNVINKIYDGQIPNVTKQNEQSMIYSMLDTLYKYEPQTDSITEPDLESNHDTDTQTFTESDRTYNLLYGMNIMNTKSDLDKSINKLQTRIFDM